MKKYVPLRIRKSPISFLIDKKALVIIIVLTALTLAAAVISTGIGELFISPLHVIQALAGKGTDMNTLVVQQFRLPRIVMALMVGAALAVSGAILQGVIRNPLASPDYIGITGGASVAAVTFLAVYSDASHNGLTISIHWLPLAAFLGAALMALLVYSMSWKNGVTPIRLVLIGIGLTEVTRALTTVMMLYGPLFMALQAKTWLTGSIYGTSWEQVNVLWPWMIILLPLTFILARDLNVQELGDDVAKSVGSAVQRQRFLLILLSAALAGGAVAFAGGIGFVGLLAPHIARKLVGSAYGALLPTAACIGAIIVLLADLIARTAFSPLDIPAGVFTAAIGAPYFIYLLFKSRNHS